MVQKQLQRRHPIRRGTFRAMALMQKTWLRTMAQLGPKWPHAASKYLKCYQQKIKQINQTSDRHGNTHLCVLIFQPFGWRKHQLKAGPTKGCGHHLLPRHKNRWSQWSNMIDPESWHTSTRIIDKSSPAIFPVLLSRLTSQEIQQTQGTTTLHHPNSGQSAQMLLAIFAWSQFAWS